MYTCTCTYRSETLSAVKEWLKKLPSQGLEAVDCGSYTLDPPQIAAIEKAVSDIQVWGVSKGACARERECMCKGERERDKEG